MESEREQISTEHGNKTDLTECEQKSGNKKRKFDDDDSDSEQKRINANAQERIRMQRINSALEDLKKCLPEQFHLHHRRMSKIRALRCAMMYIRNLTQILHEDNVRRQNQFMQAMEFMKAVCDPRFAVTQDPALVQQVSQTPTTVIPYYPYLGPLCVGSETALYNTPVQAPQGDVSSYHPRPLDFSTPSRDKAVHCNLQQNIITSSSTHQEADCIITGVVETPVKRRTMTRPRRFSATATPLTSKAYTDKPETFTSPLVGLRNDNELNLSFISASSEHAQEGAEDTQPPAMTLSDIVDGAYD